MAIPYEKLSRFAREHGKVIAIDSEGKARTLPSGEKDILEAVEKAGVYIYGEKKYTPEEFEKLIEDLSSAE